MNLDKEITTHTTPLPPIKTKSKQLLQEKATTAAMAEMANANNINFAKSVTRLTTTTTKNEYGKIKYGA